MSAVTIPDTDGLRDYIHALNDAGEHCEVAGMDAKGVSFLAGLAGAYADTEWAQVGNPWDVEVDFDGETCECCGAQRGAQVTIDRLAYPVVILGGGAGLLASPEHDAAVAARVLRDAADALEADAAGPGHGLGAHDAGIFHAALRLRERADRIEREGGESDA